MTGDKFAFLESCFVARRRGYRLIGSRCETQGIAWCCGRSPVRTSETDWVRAYERRMRRFNLTVILAALAALTILIASLAFSLGSTIEAFQP